MFSTHDTSILPAVIGENIDPKKSILFYISEESGFIPEVLRPYFKVIFKSYMPHEPGGNIHSFTLGHIDEVVFSINNLPSIQGRAINLFFSGNLQKYRSDLYRQFTILKIVPNTILTRLLRGPVRNIVLKLFGSNFSSEEKKTIIQFTNGFMKGYSKNEYKDLLLQTKILLCPKGSISTETFRLFEGLNAGCVVISERLPDLDIYRNVPVLQIDSWKTGLKKAEELLSNETLLAKIHTDSINWWVENCSYSSVAKRVAIEIGD